MTRMAAKLRQVLRHFGPSVDITYGDIARHLDLITDAEKRPMYLALRDFVRRGECTRVSPGVVRFEAKRVFRPANKTGCMYRLIRANRTGSVSVDDLVANCGVSVHTAREYLQMMTRHGITRRIKMPDKQPTRYQMIRDPGPNPVRNDTNAKKCERLRQAQKEALAQLDLAAQAVERARRAFTDLDVDTDDA